MSIKANKSALISGICYFLLMALVFTPLSAAGAALLPTTNIITRDPIFINPDLVIRPDFIRAIVPAAPTELAVVSATSRQIAVSWKDNAADETGYKIERMAAGGAWSLLSTLGANATVYTDTTVQPGVSYSYRVLAFNGVGSSAYSNTADAYALTIPANLEATARTSTEITISWSYSGSAHTGFQIQRKKGNESWRDVRSVEADERNHTCQGLEPETTYYFRVKAVGPNGDSDYSSALVATTNQPAPVTNITTVNTTTTTNNANTEVNIVDSTITNSNIASNNKITQTNEVSNINNASTAKAYVKILVNGQQLSSDVLPFLNKDNRVMVPFRAIGERLGAAVDWEAATKTAVLTLGDTLVTVPVGQQAIGVNGADQKIDTYAVIKSGRTFIPLRAVSQALGAQVEWDQSSKTVRIVK